MTGVSECSQQRSNLKDDGYIPIHCNVLKPLGFSPDISVRTGRGGYGGFC
ncbi:hypothetical protein [Photorhabdus bodei]|uniref:Uncharacterized protein n=1 Tax=Photorhabdus bodei TaxID=2029681 RepID=A0ABX0AJL2_9GAMM|nr:hypothetical protein [Photorhabdus bodei]NDK98159.1 hypothetical protein [Photorhabdus bodei]NDL02409.1 hypothetical protein [Photorhabdus bodei]NDL06483.1 hypothetical protein [Photorhabdus bodei]